MSDHMTNFMQATYETALNFGLPIISTDTSARIFAIVYVHGNNEFMCYSPKFMVEMHYIQKRFNVLGGECPDKEFVKLLQQYVDELQLFEKRNPKERYPDWATSLFKTRYNFKLIN